MWGSRKRSEEHTAEVVAARQAQDHADAVIRHVDSQDPEVKQLVTRLRTRERQNHFGEALMIAMEKRR